MLIFYKIRQFLQYYILYIYKEYNIGIIMVDSSNINSGTSFFNKIGQAFKRGWNNGNLAKGITAAGATAFTVGATGAMIHDLNNNNGCCGGSIFSGMFGGGCNYPATMGMLSVSLYGMNMGGFPMGYTGMMGMTMPDAGMMYGGVMSSPLTGGMDPYTFGQQYFQQIKAQMPETTTPSTNTAATKQNNEYAGKWDASQDTTKGQSFETATNGMQDKDGKVVEGKSFTISSASDAEGYRKDVSELAKSYAAHIDNTSGNKDQVLSKEEYIKYELSKLPEDATDEQKQNIKLAAHYAFSKMDLNQDGKADWKEIAATMATFDTNEKGKLDGKFDSKDMSKWSEAMTTQSSATFSQTLIKNYKHLFGDYSK